VKETIMKTKTYVSTCVTVVLLAACGGGGSDPLPPVTDSVPADASASAAGMANWLGQVAATAPEEREPLDVASFVPPQPDDSEPEVLK
jgi:hypothetical protein